MPVDRSQRHGYHQYSSPLPCPTPPRNNALRHPALQYQGMLSLEEVERRVAQFTAQGLPLVLTSAPLFINKATLMPHRCVLGRGGGGCGNATGASLGTEPEGAAVRVW